MSQLAQLMADYESVHLNPTNKKIHYICVPAIYTFTIGIFWALSRYIYPDSWQGAMFQYLNIGTLGMVFTIGYYLSLKALKLAIIMGAYSVLTFFVCRWIDASSWPLLWVSIAVWVAAWIAQFIGHEIEGAKPKFLDDIRGLLIGPAFVIEKLLRKMGQSLV